MINRLMMIMLLGVLGGAMLVPAWEPSAKTAILPAGPGDWPQWRGPERTGLSRETGFLKQWPAGGPAQAWSIQLLGEGYGSPAIKGDRIYVQGTTASASAVFCLNRGDGKPVWQASLGPKLNEGKGNGPRSTPTVDGDLVFVLTENGDLACLRAANGQRVWSKNILREYGGDNPRWLISESPLIDGNRVIVTPGGNGASIVALDKTNGNLVWKTSDLSDGAGYSSCIVADIGGVSTVMNFTDSAAVGVRANDGKLMWSHKSPANGTANCATPVFADSKVFFTSAYGTGAALLNLNVQGGVVKAQEAYFTKEMQNHHGGVVLVNGYLYGFSNAILTCIEFNTGKTMWKNRSVGKGSISYADGMLYLFSEQNTVGLAEANPQAYVEKGRFNVPDQGKESWAHPVIAGGKLYIRNQAMLTAFDVKGR